MSRLCEVLSILATIGPGGSAGLESRCVPSIEACNACWHEAAARHDVRSVLGQCIVIDDMMAQRDLARKHEHDGERHPQ